MVLPLIGAIGGLAAGAGALKSAFSKPTSTTNTAPWKPAQPFLRGAMNDARDLYESGGFRMDPYAGNRVAPYSAMTNSGIGMLGNMQGMTPRVSRSFDGMVNDGGGRYSSGTLSDMLDGGGMYRDFDTIRGRVQDQTKASLASMFAGGGINSGLAQDTAARAMSESLAGVEYGAYNDAQARRLAALGIDANAFDNAQGRRLSALGLAPSMQGMNMTAAGARLTGGGLQDDLAQRRINANMDRFNETQSADMDALMRYSGLMQGFGGMGGSTVAQTPRSMSDWGNMFSGAGSALTAATTLFGNRTPATA